MSLIISCRGIRRESRAVAGLTLIELMVVIAIVAVLATLLMVSIPMVRARSELAVCTSNLRSIGQGIHLYAADHDGEAPAGSEITAYINWYHLLEPYMGAMETDPEYGERLGWQQCPAKHFPTPERRNVGYGWNYQNFGSRETSPAHGWRTKLATVEQPSETIIVGCSPDEAVSRGRTYMNIYVYDERYPDYHARRHNGGGNYLMVDGSVRFYTAQMLMEALPDVYKKIKPTR